MRVVIADDERIARGRLRHLLTGQPGVEIVGECANGHQTVRMLSQRNVDVLFLDIQMPGIDGMGVAKSIPRDRAPLIVFVTAYDEYAIEAFAVRAFDYLLKPFDRERFSQTLDHLRNELARGQDAASSTRLMSMMRALERGPERLAIRNRGNVLVVDVGSIDWIEAADNYVCVHCGATTHVLRETLNALESRLDAARFVRIHRSAIVSISRIREIQPWFRGDSRVVLEGGTTLTLSRTYRDRVTGRLFGGVPGASESTQPIVNVQAIKKASL